MDVLLNPVINIIITQIVVIWSLYLSHYGEKKAVRYITFLVAFPITVWAVFIGVNEFNNEKYSTEYMNYLVRRIEKKTIDTEEKLKTVNSQLNHVSLSLKKYESVVKDVEETAIVAKNLKKSLSELDADLISQTEKSLNEVKISSANTVASMQKLDQQYARILQTLANQSYQEMVRYNQQMMQSQEQMMQSLQQFLMNQGFQRLLK